VPRMRPSVASVQTFRGTLEIATVRFYFLCTSLFAVLPSLALTADKPLPPEEPQTQQPAPRSRTFQFTYEATVTGLEPGTKARIWLPLAPSTAEQVVKIESKELPTEGKLGKDAEYGNEMLYVEAAANKSGKVPLKIRYRVTRREIRGEKREMTE